MMSLTAIAGMFIDTAAAQVMPYVPCEEVGILPGCGEPSNVLATSLITNSGIFMLRLVAALSVLFIVIGGLQLIISWGDETKITQQRRAILYSLLGLSVALLSQAIISTVATYEYVIGNQADFVIGGVLRYVLDIIMTVLNTVFVLIIVALGFRMVMAQGKSDEFSRAKAGVLWAIVGALIVNISNALVYILLSFFGV